MLASPFVAELIVVDDGSRDSTVAIVREYRRPAHHAVPPADQPGQGRGAAAGFAEATAPYVIVQDADLEYDPADYGRGARRRCSSGQADVVFGSRFLSGEPHRVLYFWHSVGNQLLTTLSNMFTNLNLTDMETCYKAFRREVIQSIEIEEDRFGFEPEITAKIAGAGWRVYEVGICYAGRTYAEGKKIGWRDGVRAGLLRRSVLAACGGACAAVSIASPTATSRRRSSTTPTTSCPTCSHSLEEADELHRVDLQPGRAPPRRATCSRSAPATASSPRSCDATRRSPRPTCRRAASTGCGRASPDKPNVDVRLVDIAAHGRRPLVRLRRARERARAHRRRCERAREAARASLRPGGRVCVFVPAFDGLYSTSTSASATGAGTAGRSSSRCSTAPGSRSTTRATSTPSARSPGGSSPASSARCPPSTWSVSVYDRVVVPTLRRIEAGRSPRFGQSLFCVGTVRD